jgi:uncharacterized protein
VRILFHKGYTPAVELPPALLELAAAKHLAYALVVRSGSKAYGIDVEGSDDDYVGVFVPRLRDLVSMGGLEKDTYAGNDPDYTVHEIGKFCRLALKGNPAILETLWNPDVIVCDPAGRALIGLRSKMIHRGSLDVYVEYAEAQMKRMVKGKGLHAKGGTYNGKYGAHLVRLLYAGIGLAASKEVQVRVPSALAGKLLEIRRGEHTMKDVLEIARPMLEDLKRLRTSNALPDRPDVEAVDALVREARLSRKDA